MTLLTTGFRKLGSQPESRVWTLFSLVLASAALLPVVWGHGRLIEPPARNAMWRLNYDTPSNFEDSELFCGGIKAQWQDHGGRCGECGDNFGDPRPRRHETGNIFARNVTVRYYTPGDVVDMVVDVETNHLGYFEFALCPRKSWNEPETESCFEPNLLEVVSATGAASGDPSTRYRLPTAANGLYLLRVKLPENLTCDYCVLRWHWKSANNWGQCEDGTSGLGCGPQETYRNCADVAIGHGLGLRGVLGANAFTKLWTPPKAKPHHNTNKL
ncbi:unnamed protein product [Ixodes hexagonus]